MAEHAFQIGRGLDDEIVALVGNDAMFSQALDAGASGCITALANVNSPTMRRVWESHQKGEDTCKEQATIDDLKAILNPYPPNPVLMKLLLAEKFGFPHWAVRLPLTPFDAGTIDRLLRDFETYERSTTPSQLGFGQVSPALQGRYKDQGQA